MNGAEFSEGDEPAIRRATLGKEIEGYRCPFCGGTKLLASWGDLPADTERVEVYCDNKPHCDVGTIVMLVTKGAGVHGRADVSALRAVDRGTDEEQGAEGSVVERDAEGHVTGRVTSYEGWSKGLSRGEHDFYTVERRKRASHVTVEPKSPR